MPHPDHGTFTHDTYASADEIVRAFLLAMERRDLAAARQMLADDFQMTFPGNKRFSRLEDMVAWAKSRYISVTKTITDMDHIIKADHSVVFCQGTLEGQWLDGTAFAGIRFIDRFVIRAEMLTDQRVWNDLGQAAHG